MLKIRSFQGLRPAPACVTEVACVPYDVVDAREAAALAAGNPRTLLRVDRAEIDLPADVNPYSDAVYAKALENFEQLKSTGALIREDQPSLYVYRLRMGNHVQTGVAAVCHTQDYEEGRIKKHEKTRPDKEDDRTRLIHTLRAQTGPILLTFRDSAEIERLIAGVEATPPLYDFVAPDGVGHTFWRVPDGKAFENAFSRLPAAYIADGHHRAAAAARVARELRKARAGGVEEADSDWFLGVLFPASRLQILPYNRLVHDLNGRDVGGFLAEVRNRFTVTENAAPQPEKAGQVSMYLQGRWYGLSWVLGEVTDPVSSLDVSVLQDRLLAPVLGIDNPRTSKRIDFVGGIRGTKALVEAVDAGAAAVAFSMVPTTVEQMMNIADAGQIMPPKSTWFEPKLRSGLCIHVI